MRRLRPPPAAAARTLAARPATSGRRRLRDARQDRLLLLAAAGGHPAGDVRRIPPRRRLRRRDRLRIDDPRAARPRRSDDVLPLASLLVRAAVGFRTIRERLLCALPKTARLRKRRLATDCC